MWYSMLQCVAIVAPCVDVLTGNCLMTLMIRRVSFAKEPCKRDYMIGHERQALRCDHAPTALASLSSAHTMRWLRLAGSVKLQISFAEYSLFYRALLQKM